MNTGLLQAVQDAATISGSIALRYFRSEFTVDTKADGSPVTIADREAERSARDFVAKHFPADGIIGEEFGEQRGTSGVRWLIDPIDGTKSFVRGVPLWGTLVSVVRGEGRGLEVLAGAAAFPALGEVIVAVPGSGCWWNGSPTRVSDVADLAAATVLVTDDRTFDDARKRDAWRDLAAHAAIARTWGDCYGYLLVATGRAEAMVDARVNPWDIACFVPIIEEAGGCITGLDGRRDPFAQDAVATNAALDDAVRRCFRARS